MSSSKKYISKPKTLKTKTVMCMQNIFLKNVFNIICDDFIWTEFYHNFNSTFIFQNSYNIFESVLTL
jgi:hypothetical protein